MKLITSKKASPWAATVTGMNPRRFVIGHGVGCSLHKAVDFVGARVARAQLMKRQIAVKVTNAERIWSGLARH